MKILGAVISVFWKLLKDFLSLVGIPLLLLFLVLFLIYLYWLIIYTKNGEKPKFEEKMPNIDSPGFFTKLFIQFPKMFAYDTLHRNPLEFEPYGINIVAGKQGAGKTITAIYMILEWKKRYTKLKVYDNYCLDDKYVDGRLDTAKDLLIHDNDIYGVVNFLDEMQNWFSSGESRLIPMEILAEICQQRKQRKVTLGTTQVFGKLAKPIREQTLNVYVPITLFGCITIVRSFDANSYDMENNKFKKSTGHMFFFVHTKELREAYDTYKKIEVYKVSEFKPSLTSDLSASEDRDKVA